MVTGAFAIPPGPRRQASNAPVRLLCPGVAGLSIMVACHGSAVPRLKGAGIARGVDGAPRALRGTTAHRPGSARRGLAPVPLEHTTPSQEGVHA